MIPSAAERNRPLEHEHPGGALCHAADCPSPMPLLAGRALRGHRAPDLDQHLEGALFSRLFLSNEEVMSTG